MDLNTCDRLASYSLSTWYVAGMNFLRWFAVSAIAVMMFAATTDAKGTSWFGQSVTILKKTRIIQLWGFEYAYGNGELERFSYLYKRSPYGELMVTTDNKKIVRTKLQTKVELDSGHPGRITTTHVISALGWQPDAQEVEQRIAWYESIYEKLSLTKSFKRRYGNIVEVNTMAPCWLSPSEVCLEQTIEPI